MSECRCCGKGIRFGRDRNDRYESGNYDRGFYIHLLCMVRHWDKHSKGINKSRCREFKGR